jgi:hypothetical protein
MKRWRWLGLILLLCILTCGCSHEEKGTAVLLGEQMAQTKHLPMGEIYRSDAIEGEVGYFSERLAATTYGESAVTRCFPLIEEYAIYLSSFPEPCELAIFRCYEKSDTDRIAEMCLSRIEQMRIVLSGTSFRARADNATVRVEGRLVIMRLLP